ncbi:MAG TPA: hypothetical protein EYO01_02620 [Phycisphaerales bacterium]|nr:hypothetical protein [Phycisphaerales bacterium]HIN84003.1 hypothetical protein [Phycisphaerales bacterium]
MSISLIVNSLPNSELLPPVIEGLELQTDTDFEIIHSRSAESFSSIVDSAKHAYIVCLGANCIPNINFIRAHRKIANQGSISVSRRIYLDQTISQHLLDNCLTPCRWNWFDLLKLRVSGHVNTIFPRAILSTEGPFASFGVLKGDFGHSSDFQAISSRGTVLQLARLITK